MANVTGFTVFCFIIDDGHTVHVLVDPAPTKKTFQMLIIKKI